MTASHEVTGYTFQADIYCPSCALKVFLAGEGLEGHGLSYIVEEAFDLLARFRGIDRYDERSFDSGDFPKVILWYQDDDEVCGCCGQLIGTQSTSVPASCDAPDRDIAYDQNVTGLKIAWAERIATHAGIVVDNLVRGFLFDPNSGNTLAEVDLQLEATEIVAARLLDSERWANVTAADISDIAYEAVAREIARRAV